MYFLKTKKIFLLTLMLMFMFPFSAFCGQVSDHGLELVSFSLETDEKPTIGSLVELKFTLKNKSQNTLTFHNKFGVFIGARWKGSQAKILNRDFGYQYQGWRLRPNQSITYQAKKILDMPGNWTFWPAYNINGRWGPFDSQKKHIAVSQPKRISQADKPGQTLVIWKGKKLPLQIFPPDNAWNMDVSRLPKHPKSDIYLANIGKHSNLHPDFGSGQKWKVLGVPLKRDKAFGIPYVVVRKGQPKVSVKFKYHRESDPGPYPIPPDAPIEKGGDHHVVVVDYDNHKLYELFQAKKTKWGWSAGSGATFDLTSNKLRPLGWTSADAAGLPIFPGLVRYEEVFGKGEINHALRFTVRKTRKAFILPATHFASSVKANQRPPMGLRVRLRKDFDIEPFPEPCKVILRALKKYGMILADNGGDWFLSGAPHSKWDDDQINWLKKVKGKDFEVVYTGEAITK